MKPTLVKLAVAMILVGVVISAVSVVIVLAHAGHNASAYHRRHPTTSLAVARGAQYAVAGIIAVYACLYAVSARALWRGKRWAWVLLLVLTAIGVLGLIRSRTILGWLSEIPTVVLLVCLLARSTREHVGATHAPLREHA